MSYIIRPAQMVDAPALADLLHDVGYFTMVSNETLEATAERVTRHLAMCLSDNSHSIYVACPDERSETVLGYVSVHWLPYLFHKGPEGYISELFVRQSARGAGIGTALLDTAIEEGRRRGCGRMMLINLRTRESYQRGFYKKHGWREREEASNFILEL